MKYSKETADNYIRDHRQHGCKDGKPRYHFSAPVGWINDPNGLVWYNGYCHVFYQYYPYALSWGPMHWGHARTKNFVDYEDLPVALAPDAAEESGCFSGGAVVDKNDPTRLHLLYTRHYEQNGAVVSQSQYAAESGDGITFVKSARPVIGTELLPQGYSITDFRDPNPVLIDGVYYAVIGAQTTDGAGAVLVYSSDDMQTFRYEFAMKSENFGKMVECPDLFVLDGKPVLVCSIISLQSETLANLDVKATLYAVMDIDFAAKTYRFLHFGSIDQGTDFYAAQSLESADGRRIMLGWLDMWNDRTAFARQKNAASVGAYSVPREIRRYGNELRFYPAREVKALFDRPFTIAAGEKLGKAAHIELEMREGSVLQFGHGEDWFELFVSGGVFCLAQKQTHHFDRVCKGTLQSETKIVEVFLDCGSVEVFVDSVEVFTCQALIDCREYTVMRADGLANLQAAYPSEKEK